MIEVMEASDARKVARRVGGNDGFLVVSNLETPFVSIDLEILQSRFRARLLVARRGISGCAEVAWSALHASGGLGWFASWHTFPAALCFSLMRKPFLLIIGGVRPGKHAGN